MFDIGWGELVLIGIVALIAIGPKELPGVLRALGQWMSKVRRMASDFQGQFQEAMREAEMEDIRKQVEQIGDTTRDFAHFDPLADRSHDKPAPAPGSNAASASGETTPVAAPAGAAASAPAASPEPDIAAPPKPTGEGRP